MHKVATGHVKNTLYSTDNLMKFNDLFKIIQVA
jgi:hypothetical protein